jgi:hypothetical protein
LVTQETLCTLLVAIEIFEEWVTLVLHHSKWRWVLFTVGARRRDAFVRWLRGQFDQSVLLVANTVLSTVFYIYEVKGSLTQEKMRAKKNPIIPSQVELRFFSQKLSTYSINLSGYSLSFMAQHHPSKYLIASHASKFG